MWGEEGGFDEVVDAGLTARGCPEEGAVMERSASDGGRSSGGSISAVAFKERRKRVDGDAVPPNY